MPWSPVANIRGPAVNTDPIYYHDFTGNADGNLVGRTADSGQPWQATGAMRSWITNGTMGFDPAQQSSSALSATYAYFDADLIDRVGARFGFNQGVTTDGGLAIGMFTDNLFNASTGSPAHLSMTPYGLEFSVMSAGITSYNRLTPIGETTTFPEFATPLLTDGVTEYDVEILLDRKNGFAFVLGPDGRCYMYQNDLIRTLNGKIPFWEPAGDNRVDPIGRVRRAWADRTPDTPRKQLPTKLEVARARHRPSSGAGTPPTRPRSRSVLPGSQFYDTTNNKPTWTDGSFWRDSAGVISGNLLNQWRAFAHRSTLYAGVVNGTHGRFVSSIEGMASGYRVVSSSSSLFGLYICDFSAPVASAYTPVVAGRTYSAVVNRILAEVTARQFYIVVNWYNAAGTQVGTFQSANATTGTGSNPVSSPIISGVAPATATQATIQVIFAPAAAGEAFRVSGMCLAPGTITGFLNP